AILISVLLPALSAARRQANATKCLASLRQLGYAMQMYAGTYKNALPVGRQDLPEIGGVPKNVNNVYWIDQVWPFANKNEQSLVEINNLKTGGKRRQAE